MRKLVLTVLLGLILPIPSYAETATKNETPLLPGVKAILDVPLINEENMDQNAYVHLIGIDSANEDYLSVAKQRLAEHNEWLRKSIAANHRVKYDEINKKVSLKTTTTINGKGYYSPCKSWEKSNCLEELLKLKEPLNNLINENKSLLARYNKIITLPTYQTYYRETGDTYPNIGLYYFLSGLKQFQAVMAIEQENPEDGFNLLQQEIDFAKKIYTSKDSFQDKIVAGNTLLTIYQTISGLLDSPKLANKLNDPKLIALLDWLPNNSDLNLNTAITYDKYSDIYFFTLYHEEIALDLEKGIYDHLKRLASEENIPVTFDLKKTINNFYLSYTQIETIINSTSSSYRQRYLALKEGRSQSMCNIKSASFKKDFFKKVDKKNVLGDYILCSGPPLGIIAEKIYRLYDVQNYLALLKLKLEIKQKGITAEQMPAFLTNAGDKAINPHTETPFEWDSEKSTLSTDWMSYSIFINDGDKLFVLILNSNN